MTTSSNSNTPPLASKLVETISLLNLKNRCIHAADESGGNISKKFEQLGVANTPENRIAYRGAMITTPGYAETIGGVILFDETFRQSYEGKPVTEILSQLGVQIGVKVDSGLIPYRDSKIEQVGKDELSLLSKRMEEYSSNGVRFTKFRVVANIGKDENERVCPTEECLAANAKLLAGYSEICHEYGVVPIVEPEVTMDGTHSIEQCQDATERFLAATFKALKDSNIYLPGVILKTNMVLPGTKSPKLDNSVCADKSINTLKKTTPDNIGAVVFLSGGQATEDAMARLKESRIKAKGSGIPYVISSSYSRALQGPALEAFGAAFKRQANPNEIKELTQLAFGKTLALNREALKSSAG